MPNYLTYPFKTMRITQSYTGITSHYPHMTGTPKDFPIDEGGKDGGRDPVYAPCDLVVKRVYGVGNRGVNTVWLESVSPVKFANGKTDYVTLMLTHPNDSDVKRLKAGMLIKRGSYICYEGMDGASGNHIHLSVGAGHFKGNGWTKNSRGKYVLTTTGGTLRPEEAFFVEPVFTTVKDSKELKFKKMPKEEPFPVGTYKVIENAPVRAGAGTKYAKKTFIMFTENAREQIKSLNNGKAANYFVKGVKFAVSEVVPAGSYHWGKCPSGWVCLEHCKKI